MRATDVSGNSSNVQAAIPSSFFGGNTQQEANAGGIDLPEGSSSTIVGSAIVNNSVNGSNTAGDANAEAGGLDVDGSLELDFSTVSGNSVQGYAPAGTLALAIDGGLQVQGSLVAHGDWIVHNRIEATSVGGFAGAAAGGLENEAQTTLVGSLRRLEQRHGERRVRRRPRRRHLQLQPHRRSQRPARPEAAEQPDHRQHRPGEPRNHTGRRRRLDRHAGAVRPDTAVRQPSGSVLRVLSAARGGSRGGGSPSAAQVREHGQDAAVVVGRLRRFRA